MPTSQNFKTTFKYILTCIFLYLRAKLKKPLCPRTPCTMQKWVFGLDNRAIKNGKNLIFNSTRNSNLDFRCCIGFESSGFRRFYCLKFVDSSSRRLQRLELIFHEEKWPQRNFCCWKKSGTFYWYAMDWCRTSITGMYLLVFRLRRPCMQPLGGGAASGQAASGPGSLRAGSLYSR